MELKKKSQISVQINWLFVLIAGSIILLFFIGIVFRQKAISDTTLISSIAEDLDLIITGVESSASTATPVPIPPVTIKFSCEGEEEPWFGVDWERTGVDRRLSRKIVFAPDKIKGLNLITWSLRFQAPFTVTNFVYLTSPDVRYIFVFDNDPFAQKIYDGFPIIMNKIKTSNLNTLTDEFNYKVKYVFFRQPPISVPVSGSAIWIDSHSNKIHFYKSEGNTLVNEGASVYLGDAMIYGGIIAENKNFYECAITKAFQRLSLSAQVFAEREKMLREYNYDSGDYRSNCYAYFLLEGISNIIQPANLCAQRIEACSITSLKNSINNIITTNDILKRQRCPLLY